jgi:hypothetical protein
MLNDIKKKITSIAEENKLIILVSLIFIGWKFFLISVFFNNDFSKSEEALVYTGHIDSINQCSYVVFCKQFLLSFENYGGFVHLSYRLFFGFIGHLLKIDSTSVFHLSFYIGIIILVPSLIFFLKNIETDKKLVAFLLFFLALYNGGGSHGFWWVVPDFFATLLFFVAFAIIIGNYKHWKLILAILIPVGFYTHTMFVYLMTIPIFFYIFYYFFTKKTDVLMIKKIAFSFFILAIFYIPTSYHIDGNPYGPEAFIAKSNIVTSGVQSIEKRPPSASSTIVSESNYDIKEYLFPGFGNVKERYFDFIFFEYDPIFIIIFLSVISVLFYYKQYKILSIYFVAIAFTLASSINKHADRSLTFIWPITYLLYAYGVWFFFKLTNEFIKNRNAAIAIKTILYSGITIFIIINLIYSYGMNQSIYFNPQQFLDNYVWHIR